MCIRILFVYCLLLLYSLCNYTSYASNCNKTVIVNNSKDFIDNINRPNTIFKVKGNVDLKGDTLTMPLSSEIVLLKGSIINGCLVGKETGLDVRKKSSTGVRFEGTWLSPIIDDDIFLTEYLSDDDIIASINNLQSRNIYNTIILKKQKYEVTIKESSGHSLCLLDSVKLVNHSLIELKPNNHKGYSIIMISNATNVEVTGGHIHGDVGRHKYQKGTSSEWGMGINISASSDVFVHDIIISHCTGDGIYITGQPTDYIGDYTKASQNVVLKKVVCDSNRRQGLSVISVDGLLVEGCSFMNTGKIEKTSPAAGIDIEPNVGNGYNNSVRNIQINNCVFKGNAGRPFDVDLGVSDGKIDNFENIVVKNCTADGPFFFGAQNVSVYNTTFESIIVRPFEAPVECQFENCYIYGGGIIIKDVLKHDQLYYSNKQTQSLATIKLKGCELIFKPTEANKSKKLVYFETRPENKVTILFDSCDITVPNRSSIQTTNTDGIDVSYKDCTIKEAQ